MKDTEDPIIVHQISIHVNPHTYVSKNKEMSQIHNANVDLKTAFGLLQFRIFTDVGNQLMFGLFQTLINPNSLQRIFLSL